jgi:hypothetical protein
MSIAKEFTAIADVFLFHLDDVQVDGVGWTADAIHNSAGDVFDHLPFLCPGPAFDDFNGHEGHDFPPSLSIEYLFGGGRRVGARRLFRPSLGYLAYHGQDYFSSLICGVHQEDPQDDPRYREYRSDEPDKMNIPEYKGDYEKRAEGEDRLPGVELDVFIVRFEHQEQYPGDPPTGIA